MTPTDVAILAVRLAVGITFAAHGAQKVFGWWGGPGFTKWSAAIARMGLRPTWFWAAVSAGVELVGGLLFIFGLLTPVVSALLVAQSIYIVVRAHLPRGFWSSKGGIEFPLQLVAASFLVVATGPGALALDRALGIEFDGTTRVALLVIAIVGALVAMAIARPQPQPAAQPPANPQPQRPA